MYIITNAIYQFGLQLINGIAVVSNEKVIVAVKQDYPAEYEGKTITPKVRGSIYAVSEMAQGISRI